MVSMNTQRITLITDTQLQDFTPMDKHFQIIYIQDCSMTQLWKMLKEKKVSIKCDVVWLMTGNSQLPLPCDLSPINQMRKLIMCIIAKSGRKIAKLVVGSVLPRPDKEVQLEQQIIDMNAGFHSAVKDLRHNMPLARNVIWLPVHKLFLERFQFVDFATGLIMS